MTFPNDSFGVIGGDALKHSGSFFFQFHSFVADFGGTHLQFQNAVVILLVKFTVHLPIVPN